MGPHTRRARDPTRSSTRHPTAPQVAITELDGGMQMAVLPRGLVARVCAVRKVGRSDRGRPHLTWLDCPWYTLTDGGSP